MKDTYNVQECADFLNVSYNLVIRMAGDGLLPGAKIGKSWVFLRSDMIHYLRNEIRRQQSERQARFQVEQEIGPAQSVVPQLPSTEELVRMANELCGEKAK